MNHADHIRLIQNGVITGTRGAAWADLGSGHGAFTLALADCLQGAEAIIYSVDLNQRALDAQQQTMQGRFPQQTVHYRVADFTKALDLPPLDGIVMANALHFVRDKVPVVRRLYDLLKPDGRLVIVEYDTARGNRWVPHPVTFAQWQQLASQADFVQTTQLASQPSRFLGAFFSSVSLKSSV